MKLVSFLVAFAIAITPLTSWADEPQGTLKRIIDSRQIRLGYLKDLSPFSFAGADGRPRGYSIELCHRVVSGIRNNYGVAVLDIQWVEVTSSNRFQRVADGTVDLECGASAISLSRLRLVDFSAMIWIDSKTFLVKRGQPLRTQADLAGKKLAVVEGTSTEKVLRDVLLGQVLGGGPVTTEVVVVKDRQEGVDALVQGSVHAFAADRMVLAGLARATPDPGQLALADFQFAYEPYGLPLRRNEADFRFAVNQVLAGLYRSGAIKEIAHRWFGDLGPLPPLLDSLYDLNGLRD
ncbi:MAG TPA: amino acid ABC transporter substrate-binding protein [Vicinamibacterales bacterium]